MPKVNLNDWLAKCAEKTQWRAGLAAGMDVNVLADRVWELATVEGVELDATYDEVYQHLLKMQV